MPNNEEQDFRDRLHDYVSPVNAEETWLAVQAGLQPKRKRRWIGWWIPTLLLLLGAGAYLTYAQFQQPRTQVQSQLEERSASGQPEDGPLTPLSNPQLSTTAQADSPSPDQATTSPLRNTTGSVAANNVVPPTPEPRALSSIDETAKTARRNAPAKNTESLATTITSSMVPAEASWAAEPKVKQVLSDIAPAVSDLPTLERKLNVADLALLPWPAFELSNSKRPDVATSGYAFTKQGYRPWSLSVEGDLSMIDLSVDDFLFQQDTLPMVSLPEVVYQPLEAVSAAILLGYQTRSGWQIRTGLSVTRINTVANLTTETIEEGVMREGLTDPQIINGDTIYSIGLVSGTERTLRTQRYYNKLTLIDVPILLGKEFSFSRWRLGLEAGPVINLRAKGSARYLQVNGEFSPRSESDAIFRPSLGVMLRVGASAGYRLTERLEVYGGFRYRTLPSSGLERDDLLARTTMSLLGGSLGLRLRL